MLDHDETFEEEFSNWARTVLNLQNVRDGSISYIKHKMEPFIDELIHMHGPDEEDHFKELLIKVAVNGEVKKKKPKKNTNGHSWALYDTRCAVCVNVFQRILDNFYRCQSKEWKRHASWKTISPSNYWWIVSKLYVSHNCKIETSLGPEEVEPFAVLSLMHRCKLFQKNLLWFDVGQVIQTRHELVHSINNRLSGDKKDKYLLEMKVLIKKVAVDTSTTDVLKAFEEVENSTIALFTEDGEIHQLANKALQLQKKCLNADFKSPKGVHATIKSLAMSKIESMSQELKLKYKDQLEKKEYELQKKELERKNAILETQIQQHKTEELERKLQYETERNKTYEDNFTEIRSNIDKLECKLQYETEKNKLYGDNFTEIRSNMENKFKGLQQEKSKQAEEISSLKSEMEIKFKDLQLQKSKQDDEISSLKNTMENKFEDLQQEKSKPTEEISSIESEMEIKFMDLQQEKSKQDDEISSLKNAIENKIKDLHKEKSKQNDEISTLKCRIEKEIKDVKQDKNKQDVAIASLKSIPENKIKGLKQERSKQDHGISMLKRIVGKKIKDVKQDKSQQDDEKSSYKSAISTSHIYEVQSFSDVNVRVDSDKIECNITDMCQMADGTVILLDQDNKKLKRLDDEFNLKDFYHFDEMPLCVVTVSLSKVAVLHYKSIIDIILLDENIVVEKSVVLECKPFLQGGMIYCNNQFWKHCIDGLYVYSLSGSMVKRMENLSLDLDLAYINSSTICTNKDKTRVYVIKDNMVYVLYKDGEVLSTFTLINESSYITFTGDYILIISSYMSGNVDMYDIEGTRLGRLISKTDMLSHPNSMLYDEKKCRFIIGSWQEENIRVFQLKKKDYRQVTTRDCKT